MCRRTRVVTPIQEGLPVTGKILARLFMSISSAVLQPIVDCGLVFLLTCAALPKLRAAKPAFAMAIAEKTLCCGPLMWALSAGAGAAFEH